MLIDYFKKNINLEYFDGIKVNDIRKLLDLGTGTGIIALFFQMIKSFIPKFKSVIYASDISEDSINCAKKNEVSNGFKNQIKFFQSDLFSSFPENLKNSFNIIIFNPPYLPSLSPSFKVNAKSKIDVSWNGGEEGFELLIRFIHEVKDFLNFDKKSYIYFINSSITSNKKFFNFVENEGFENKILDKKHFFFEDIFLNRLELKKN
jgi:HemK-related putative methylase